MDLKLNSNSLLDIALVWGKSLNDNFVSFLKKYIVYILYFKKNGKLVWTKRQDLIFVKFI